MITDRILGLLAALLETVTAPLPRGSALQLPSLDSFWNALAGIDSLIPILGPITAGLTLLGALGAFLLVRLVLVVWNLIYP